MKRRESRQRRAVPKESDTYISTQLPLGGYITVTLRHAVVHLASWLARMTDLGGSWYAMVWHYLALPWPRAATRAPASRQSSLLAPAEIFLSFRHGQQSEAEWRAANGP